MNRVQQAQKLVSILSAYLSRASTQRVLSKKPGQEGFSLLELIIVVAVLAILASVAIPAFTEIIENAMQVSAKNAIAQIIKECEFKKAMGDTSPTFNVPNLHGYTVYPSSGSCDGDRFGRLGAEMTLLTWGASMPVVIEYNVRTRHRRCSPGTNISWCPALVW